MNRQVLLIIPVALWLVACGPGEPPSEARLAAVDELVEQVQDNIDDTAGLDFLMDIDHARLGADAGSFMPPARVVLFSDAALEAELLAENPLTGVELPFRVLGHESTGDGKARVIFNRWAYVASRYGLPTDSSLGARYESAHERAVAGIDATQRADFERNEMQPDGIVTLTSPHTFEETVQRVENAIAAQDDTVSFGRLDLTARAAGQGVTLAPMTLILFGGPGPGAKAMAPAPTLGLDAFCQKFLVWTDDQGVTHLSFNDLTALADRQGVEKALALRVVDRRIGTTFREALGLDDD